MNSTFFFGKKALLDAINFEQKIIKVYLTKNNTNLIRTLNEANIEFEIKDNNFFKKFNDELNHQGIAFQIEQKPKLNLTELLNQLKERTSSIVLILDELEDPRNFGAILRSCDAFKIDAIFYKKNNQVPINDLVNKVSMGAANYLNTCEIVNIVQLINKLKEQDYWVYASVLDQDSIAYYQEKYPNKVALIVGNENKGINQLVIKNSDVKIYIPMYGHVQSLNASVATGILLSHLSFLKNQ